MIARNIPQAHLTGECWTVQREGLAACKTCEYRDTEDCGGQSIRTMGKNSKGFTVPLAPGKTITMTGPELSSLLSGFTGTEKYYRDPRGLIYTDGVQAMAQETGGYWLITAIASYQTSAIRDLPFQFWTLAVQNRAAVLTMQEYTGRPYLVRREIEFTDFPSGTWEFYLIGGVLILPSEY